MTLTDTACRNRKASKKPVKFADSGGLYLFITPRGSKLWRMDYRYEGLRKTLSFGPYPNVSLLQARTQREEAKKTLVNKQDPALLKVSQKREAKISSANTFEGVAREWLENQRESWTKKYAGHVETRLENDVFPELGARPIADIETLEVLDVLRKVERRGALDIAKRLRQTCGQIFRYAVITGRAKRDPTADLKGALKVGGRAKHHKAMSRDDLPGFLTSLKRYDGELQTQLGLELIILTFVRTGELRVAEWKEFEDLDGKAPIWRIPAERMKMRTEHLVPLSKPAIAVLKRLKVLTGSKKVLFPSKCGQGVMSNNTLLFALYRMGYHGRATVHGFRGLASTCLNEAGFQSDWIERQLSHDENDEVRRAYNSAQYLGERRKMMNWWGELLLLAERTGKVSLELVRVP